MVRAQALSEPGADADAAGPGAREHCASCGAALAEDQEWCLECGAARTLLHRPPSWRIPLVIAAMVVALVVIGLLIALVSLSIQANHG